MASNQEEEVLGKAYDGRLMRRLLRYLRPYKWHVVVALAAIILKSAADVLGPFLTKIAIDKYLAKSPNSHSWIGDRLSRRAADRHRADWRPLHWDSASSLSRLSSSRHT
jgi:ATP-binding cassette, subfamily B, multidrug efflux pump